MISKLQCGFKSSSCPITNQRTVNVVLNLSDYHISYNPSIADYGCDTTAIVLKGSVFFILNGDHCKAISAITEETGLQGCIDYFIENIQQANAISEHYIAIGVSKDLFGITKTAIESIGQHNLDRISKKVQKYNI